MIYLFLFCKPRLQRTILLSVLVFYSLVLCAQSLDYERIINARRRRSCEEVNNMLPIVIEGS